MNTSWLNGRSLWIPACSMFLAVVLAPSPAEARKDCNCWVGFEEGDVVKELETGLSFGDFESGKKRDCSRRCSELCGEYFADAAQVCADLGRAVGEADLDRFGCFSVVGRVDNNNNTWDYDGRPCAGFACQAQCECQSGTFFPQAGRCLTVVCTGLEGLPAGEKGGGYYAISDTIYQTAAAQTCVYTPVDDGSCTTEPKELQATAEALQQIGCGRLGANSGQLDVQISGGEPGYTCTLEETGETVVANDGSCNFGGLPAGTWNVLVEDSRGSTTTTSAELEWAVSVEVLALEAPSCCGCDDGVALAKGQGGTSPYTFRWIGNGLDLAGARGLENQQSLPAGTYTVTMTDDNGCHIQQEVTVPRSPACPNGTGGGGSSFPDDGATTLFSLGTLVTGRQHDTSVTVENKSCEGAQDFSVSVEGAPWFRLAEGTEIEGVRPGNTRRLPALVDLEDAAPGLYTGSMTITCLTCPPTCTRTVRQLRLEVQAVPDPRTAALP